MKIPNLKIFFAIAMATSFFNTAYAEFSKSGVQTDTTWLQGEILNDAKKLTRTLTRDITVYSWVARENISGFSIKEPMNVTDANVINSAWSNATDRMTRFWAFDKVSGRAQEGGAMAPNGLYVATEPSISRSYGGRNFAVYRMVLPAGTRYIDGRSRRGAAVTPRLEMTLLQRGCQNPLGISERNPVFTARNLIKSDTHQQACRQALIEIAEATAAKAILYIFKSEPVQVCKQVYPWNSAFVLIDPTAVKENSFQPLVGGATNPADGLEAEREMINAVFENTLLENGSIAQKPFVNSSSAGLPEMQQYAQDNFFACNRAIREW